MVEGVVGPATFATLAMDADVKESVMNDLNRFVERREYYRRVGKAWKRGYLLYGLPGTGKSSLIAAMANYLNFDIYDLELADMTNSMLRQLLLDPALFRPGRMDVHINMSYCTPCGFRLLASNYHGITQHERFEDIDDLIGKVEITPRR
uniref:Putative ATPase, AAA-type, core, P-loop containing nucleoside triphosphate hydrolase n=1 Tax=Helianthus annuus TaxID=4232 RepID=A0A251S461_HELAN